MAGHKKRKNMLDEISVSARSKRLAFFSCCRRV